MGSRANYIIIENSVQSLFFTHWGGQRIDVDLFWGPEISLAFVRTLEPARELLDSVWCEGAAYINADTRELMLFGGEELKYVPGLRNTWLELLKVSWRGWEVSWAGRGIIDIAERLGIPRDEVYVDQPVLVVTEEQMLSPLKEKRSLYEALITVRKSDGSLQDFLGAGDGLSYLALGPKLLALTDKLQPFEMTCEDRWDVHSVYLEPQNCKMWVMAKGNFTSIDPRIERVISEHWPGWTVDCHDLGWGHHWRLTGRNPSAFELSIDERVKWAAGSVLRDSSMDPAKTFDTLLSHFGEGNVEITTPSYFYVPPQNNAEERRERLMRLLKAWKPDRSFDI